MRLDILSLFPGYFESPFNVSILKRAIDKGIIEINLVNIRDFAKDSHQTVDDRPYGGGPGMVLMPGPVTRAIAHVKREGAKVIYLSPQGRLLNVSLCRELVLEKHLIFLCGHYEGIDERVVESVDEEVSIGDYVLPNGCSAAVVVVEALARYIPGVIGHPSAVKEDSFEANRFDCPHYTRPAEFQGKRVPSVLLSGNHQKITEWRRQEALKKTKRVRPDLLVQNEGATCKSIAESDF